MSPTGSRAIFDRYYSEIHGFAARRLGTGLANDVASETFHDAWGTPEPPSDDAHARARADLLARAADPSPRRLPARRRARLGWWRIRLVAVATAAGVFAAGFAMVQNLNPGAGTDGFAGVPPASAAEALELAAAAAESKPFTPPRDDQWIYIEDRITSSADRLASSAGARGLMQSEDGRSLIRRSWRRADGGGPAWIDENGRLQVETLDPRREGDRPLRAAVGPLAGYRTLAALPTAPDALLRWAYRQAKDITGGGLTEHGDVYSIPSGMLRENVLPPELEAAIFRALKEVPGVTVETVDDAIARPALALVQTEDWLREELLLDPHTYRYRGERGTITKNTFIDPEKAGNESGQVVKGPRVTTERIRTAIVDEPGERR